MICMLEMELLDSKHQYSGLLSLYKLHDYPLRSLKSRLPIQPSRAIAIAFASAYLSGFELALIVPPGTIAA